jgi:hypothetical protein
MYVKINAQGLGIMSISPQDVCQHKGSHTFFENSTQQVGKEATKPNNY